MVNHKQWHGFSGKCKQCGVPYVRNVYVCEHTCGLCRLLCFACLRSCLHSLRLLIETNKLKLIYRGGKQRSRGKQCGVHII